MAVTKSNQEELLAVLWIIAAILAFGFRYSVWGWIFVVKSVCQIVAAIHYVSKEE
jgi:hypothetical protein